VIGRGARATEALLLAEVAALDAAARAEPRLLARPVRVVVPSRSLREHVAAAIVRHFGRGVAGVVVQTLHGVALEILAAAGEAAPRGDALFPVLVRRAARAEPALRDALEPLEDAWGVVAAAVADLLDAGFDPDTLQREAVEDALAAAASGPDAALGPDAHARAAALVRVAGRAAREAARLGVGRRGARLARAAEWLRADDGLLPSRARLVHGFADATGVASDLLEALARAPGARVFLDRPPDPAEPAREDAGAAFTDRLRARLGAVLPVREDPRREPPARRAGVRASGAWVEARAAGERIRALLDAGASPERIGVVARDLGPYALGLRAHFTRLGIPFSGVGALGPPAGAGRRLHALLELLVRGEVTPADRWLDALRGIGRLHRFDLRVALHAAGAARLRDVARLEVDALLAGDSYLPLPVRRGLVEVEGEDGERATRLGRRRLDGDALRAAVQSAQRCAAALAAWPGQAPVSAHLVALAAFADEMLRWHPHAPERRLLAERVQELEAELAGDPELERDELGALLERALRGAGCDPLGGAGAGVQVLGAVEARARSFDHLFLLGLNRDVFPRPFLEDPLLPDDARARLEALFPEIPLKRRGFDEEHYLFAQLLSASPEVVLSWQIAGDDGRARAPSPLVERLRLAEDSLPLVDAPSLQARPDGSSPPPRTGQEAALAEALHGTRASFTALLPAALAEREELDRAPGAPPDAARLARARLAVLDELDVHPLRAPGLGPFFGFAGPVRPALDPRREPLAVTRIEGLVACPWQLFLERLLGVEPPPDALEALPELTPLRVGSFVHRVLQRIVADALGDPLDGDPLALADAAAREPRAVAWPAPDALERILHEEARAVLRAEGIGLAGFAALLIESARERIEAARGLGWPEPGSDVRCLGAEVEGVAELAGPDGRTLRVPFRADRADLAGGVPRLIDYKTGAVPEGADRRAKLLARVRTGSSLQAATYAAATGGEGRFLFLKAGPVPEAVFEASAGDTEMRSALEAGVRTALAVFERGSFFPRLSEVDKAAVPERCKRWCEVHAACLFGDASARARLREWTRRAAPASDAEAALLALWRLPKPPKGGAA
jgi:hypothetical protein